MKNTNTIKIDRRRHYILMLDTETANTIQFGENRADMSNVLFYDLGAAVIDTHGNVYETVSFVNSDIFCDEWQLMTSAYYAAKIPTYVKDIAAGRRVLANNFQIRRAIHSLMEKYGITEIAAHNARFDVTALNNTIRYITKSKYRYFLPYGTDVIDTMKMATDVICTMPTYKRFCDKHGFKTAKGNYKKTAEVLYRFITLNPDFEEKHTGLEDVHIEAQILAYCYRQHKKMRKYAFSH